MGKENNLPSEILKVKEHLSDRYLKGKTQHKWDWEGEKK